MMDVTVLNLSLKAKTLHCPWKTPRQFSNDSGHERLSPLSLNPTITVKNQKPKDWILDPKPSYYSI